MQSRISFIAGLLMMTGVLAAPRFSARKVFRPGPQLATFYSEIDNSEQPSLVNPRIVADRSICLP